MSFLTKELFKEELSKKIYPLNHQDKEDFIQAFNELIQEDSDLKIDTNEEDQFCCEGCGGEINLNSEEIYCEWCYDEIKTKVKGIE